ncbi:MAG: hypothetical protein NZZ41_07875, partial [Candidatus Dojkabacteria bacterium]|nr:hypothetical protein [Candidatus Dojkabacteria bacterium]
MTQTWKTRSCEIESRKNNGDAKITDLTPNPQLPLTMEGKTVEEKYLKLINQTLDLIGKENNPEIKQKLLDTLKFYFERINELKQLYAPPPPSLPPPPPPLPEAIKSLVEEDEKISKYQEIKEQIEESKKLNQFHKVRELEKKLKEFEPKEIPEEVPAGEQEISYFDKKPIFTIDVKLEHLDIKLSYLNDLTNKIVEEVKELIKNKKIKFPFRLQIKISALFSKRDFRNNSIKYTYKIFRTVYPTKLEYVSNSIEQFKEVCNNQLRSKIREIENFQEGESGWSLEHIKYIKARIWEVGNIFANAEGFIETPEWLKNRRAIINIQNKDDKCFIKCIYRALNLQKNHNERDIKESKIEEFKKQYNCKSIEKEISPQTISEFEENNKDISINIYKIPMVEPTKENNKKIKILYQTRNYDTKHHINLGLLKEGN